MGLVRFGVAGSLGGATLTMFERQYAQETFLGQDAWTELAVAAEDGVGAEALRDLSQLEDREARGVPRVDPVARHALSVLLAAQGAELGEDGCHLHRVLTFMLVWPPRFAHRRRESRRRHRPIGR